MYILAFILLLLGLAKVFSVIYKGKDTVSKLSDSFPENYESSIKAIVGVIMFNGLVEIVCSLFILVII